MKTPLYIQNLLSRCEWAVEAGRLPKGCDPGYTLLLHKRSAYALAKTLAKEADALKGWAEREMLKLCPYYDNDADPIAVVNHCPGETRYRDQWAVITIWDPLMKHIEKFIPEKDRPGKHIRP